MIYIYTDIKERGREEEEGEGGEKEHLLIGSCICIAFVQVMKLVFLPISTLPLLSFEAFILSC